MKFAHSIGYLKDISTLFNIETSLWFSALSVYYIHAGGHTIDLYATKDFKFLKDLIGYDNYYEIQDDKLIPVSVYSKFKMLALNKMPIDTIHIDNDVFISKNTAFELIKNSDADMLVQYVYNIQDKEYPENICMQNELINSILYLMSCGILTEFPEDLTSINGGLYKFNNPELKQLIVENYFSFYHNNADILNKIPTNYVLDNYCEEYKNYHTAIDNGYTVKSLEPMRSITDDNPIYDFYQDSIGFRHYYGIKGKYLTQVKYELAQRDYSLFNKIDKWLKDAANKIILA